MKLYTIFLVLTFFSSSLCAQNRLAKKFEEHQSYIQDNVKIERDLYSDIEIVPPIKYQNPLSMLGLITAPFSQIRLVLHGNGKLIYDQVYTIEEFGLRKIDSKYTAVNSKFHVITAGDSNTFGEGVSESEQLPVLLSKEIPSSHPYNFGVRGAGPNKTLALMEFFPWEKLIKEPRGIFIYNYYDFLIERVIGYRHIIEWSFGHDPYYDLDENGVAVYKGLFTSRPLTWFFQVLNYFPYVNKLFPALPRPTYRHTEIVAKIFLKMQNEYKKKFPEGNFVVAVNYFYGLKKAERMKDLEQELIKNKVNYIILPASKNSDAHTFADGHLTANGHQLEADLFLKILPLDQIVGKEDIGRRNQR